MLKSIKQAVILIACCASLSAFAAQHSGGFSEKNQGVMQTSNVSQLTNLKMTVKDAKQLTDDSYVILEGNIVKRVDHDDKYLFKDASDSITVEIDSKVWRGVSADSNTKIRLLGEVDQNMMGTKIDVKQLELAQ